MFVSTLPARVHLNSLTHYKHHCAFPYLVYHSTPFNTSPSPYYTCQPQSTPYYTFKNLTYVSTASTVHQTNPINLNTRASRHLVHLKRRHSKRFPVSSNICCRNIKADAFDRVLVAWCWSVLPPFAHVSRKVLSVQGKNIAKKRMSCHGNLVSFANENTHSPF